MGIAKVPQVLVLFASGMEEMEAIILVDVLRRGGVEVITVSGESSSHAHSGSSISPENLILASRNTWHLADANLDSLNTEEFKNIDMLLIPGGLKGAEYWNSHPRMGAILSSVQSSGGWIGAICAAPKILLNHGILKVGDRYTAYPGVTPENSDYTGAVLEVLPQKKIITSKGPGTAFDMALKILEILCSREVRDKVKRGLQIPE